MSRIPLTIAPWLLTLFATSLTMSAEVQIARDGKSEYNISLAAEPTPGETLAAHELAKYVRQISGVDLSIREGDDNRTSHIKLVSGRRAVDGFVKPGDDVFHIAVDASGAVSVHAATDRGLLRATYALLEQLGCRFLAPQLEHYHGTAEVIPARPTLSLPVGVVERSPVLAFRKLYVEEGRSHDARSLRQIVEWMPKAGYNVLVVPMNYQGRGRVRWDNWRAALTPELQRRGIVIEVGGHGYQNFLSAEMADPDAPDMKLFDTHPDWFARDERGIRRRETNWVFNTANPDAVRFFVNKVIGYLNDRPEIQIFDLWPPDGERWDESDESTRQGTPTDRMVMLTNHVRDAVAKVRPDVRIECIAYARYTEPPASQHLAKDVLVDFCPIDQSFEAAFDDPASSRNAGYAKSLRGWRAAFADGDISLYSYYRKYAWQSLPVVLPHYMQQDLRAFRSIGVTGVSTYAEPGDWFAYELNHYALARLAWDPDADIDALVREFCAARYGPLAGRAADLFAVLEDVVRTNGSLPFTSLKSPERIDAARVRLDAAADRFRAASLDAKVDAGVRQNAQRLLAVCEHATRDLAIQSMRARRRPEGAVRDAVGDLNGFLASHAGEGISLDAADDAAASNALSRRYGLSRGAPAPPATTSTAPARR